MNYTLLLFLPPKFEGGLDVVYIISVGAIFSIAGGANGQIIFSSNNYWKGGALIIGVVIISFIGNLILIPLYGINGAALATTIAALLTLFQNILLFTVILICNLIRCKQFTFLV